MNPHFVHARNSFWIAYGNVRHELAKLPRQTLVNLQHEAAEIKDRQQENFSDLAAAQLVHAATTSILEEK